MRSDKSSDNNDVGLVHIGPGQILKWINRVSNKYSISRILLKDLLYPIEKSIGSDELERALRFIESIGEMVKFIDFLQSLSAKDYKDFVDNWQKALEVSNPYLPLCNIDDLEKLLKAFIVHYTYNQNLLIETGYPKEMFELSPWLDYHLNKLYFVKKIDVFPFIDRRDPWKKSINGENHLYPSCYKDADYIEFFKKEDAKKLEKERARVFDLNHQILLILFRSVEKREMVDLWNECHNAIKTMSPDEVKFLISMDNIYLEKDLIQLWHDLDYSNKYALPPSGYFGGGLIDMLNVIFHVIKELDIRTLSDIRDILGGLMPRTRDIGIVFNLNKFYRDLASGMYPRYSEFFNKCRKRETIENEYMENLQSKILSDLGNSLQVGLTELPKPQKPVVIVKPYYNVVIINGKRYSFRPRVIEALSFIIKKQIECISNGVEPKFDRIELCNELNIPQTKSTRKSAIRSIFQKTEFSKLIVNLKGEKNKYLLDIDMKKSAAD